MKLRPACYALLAAVLAARALADPAPAYLVKDINTVTSNVGLFQEMGA